MKKEKHEDVMILTDDFSGGLPASPEAIYIHQGKKTYKVKKRKS